MALAAFSSSILSIVSAFYLTEKSAQMDEQTVVHPYNGIWFSAKKKWTAKLWKDMEEAYQYITKWKKPIWKGYMLYDFNDMTM